MIVKLLTEHHLEFLSLKAGCWGSSESKLVKMSNCWKSHATAYFWQMIDEEWWQSTDEVEKAVWNRRSRCHKCDACLRQDCRKCNNCLDMPRYGGSGKLRQGCSWRQCTNLKVWLSFKNPEHFSLSVLKLSYPGQHTVRSEFFGRIKIKI